MLDYQAFISKINHGIGQAIQTIKLCCQQRDMVKQQWLQRHTRTLALSTVVEKYQIDELKQEVQKLREAQAKSDKKILESLKNKTIIRRKRNTNIFKVSRKME